MSTMIKVETPVGEIAKNYFQTVKVFDDYQIDSSQSPVRLCPVAGDHFPVTETGRIASLVVTYNAGYGSDETATPPMLKAMIKLLVGHWFKNREAISNKGVVTTYPLAFEALRDQVRVNEFVKFEIKQS